MKLSFMYLLTMMMFSSPAASGSSQHGDEGGETAPGPESPGAEKTETTETTEKTETRPAKRKIRHVAILTNANIALGEHRVDLRRLQQNMIAGDNLQQEVTNLRQQMMIMHEPTPHDQIPDFNPTRRTILAEIQPGTGSVKLLINDRVYRFSNSRYVELLQREENDIISRHIRNENDIENHGHNEFWMRARILARHPAENLRLSELLGYYTFHHDRHSELTSYRGQLFRQLEQVRENYRKSEEVMKQDLTLELFYTKNRMSSVTVTDPDTGMRKDVYILKSYFHDKLFDDVYMISAYTSKILFSGEAVRIEKLDENLSSHYLEKSQNVSIEHLRPYCLDPLVFEKISQTADEARSERDTKDKERKEAFDKAEAEADAAWARAHDDSDPDMVVEDM